MKAVALGIAVALFIPLANAQNCTPEAENALFAKEMAQALKDIGTIKPGMTRADLAKLFQLPGGIVAFNRAKTTLVYRRSNYIRVDIQFAIGEGEARTPESPNDVIKSISAPYLAWPVYD